MQAPLPCRGDTRVVCADIGYRHSSATLARLSSRCRTTPPKLVVITPLPLAGGAAGTLPSAYAYASVSLCRCHALSAAQAVHSCHISGREVFGTTCLTSSFVRRCCRIVGLRQPHATPTPELSSAASGIGAAVGITSQLAVPAATLRGGEPPLSTARNLAVRADRPHSHPFAMTASPIASLNTHTAFLHGHAGLPQLIIAPTSYAATHGCRESVAHDMTQPCTTFRVAPCLYGAYRSIRLWRTLTSGRRLSCGIRTACYSLHSGR